MKNESELKMEDTVKGRLRVLLLPWWARLHKAQHSQTPCSALDTPYIRNCSTCWCFLICSQKNQRDSKMFCQEYDSQRIPLHRDN